MDYSIEDYLNRFSTEELEMLLKFCREHNEDYGYILEDIYKIINKESEI